MSFVIAVDFGGTKIAAAAATLTGEIIDQARLATEPELGAQQAVRRAVSAARHLIDSAHKVTGATCVAGAAVCPGLPRSDRVDLAPNVQGWEDLAIGTLMSQGLGLDVAVGNDVRAAALAELRWGTLRDADPALFINLGTGVASALIVGGQVVPGAHGAAGEIGYSLLGSDNERTYAAGAAPLEELAGGRFIGVHASHLSGRPMTAVQAFADPDPAIRKLVDCALNRLSTQVANLALQIDPQRIAFGGGMMASRDRILAAVTRRLRQVVPFPPAVMAARFIDDGGLRGAVALALDQYLAPGIDTTFPTGATNYP
jgi:glucokinase